MFDFEQEHGIDRIEMLKWIGERNRHVPASELAFMMGLPPLESDDAGDEFNWE